MIIHPATLATPDLLELTRDNLTARAWSAAQCCLDELARRHDFSDVLTVTADAPEIIFDRVDQCVVRAERNVDLGTAF